MDTDNHGPYSYKYWSSINWFPTNSTHLIVNKNENVQWKITPNVTEHNAARHLSLQLECLYEHKSSNLWSCDAEIVIEVSENFSLNFTYKKSHFFDKYTTSMDLGPCMKLTSMNRLHLNKTRFYIRARIRMISSVGIQKLSFHGYELLSPQNNNCVTVKMYDDFEKKDHQLYIDKFLLLSFSSVFREMLSNNNNEIDLGILDCDVFIDLIGLISGKKIVWDRCEDFLSLAAKYNIQFVVQECEDVCVSDDNYVVRFGERICYAEEFKLSKLQVVLLDKMPIKGICNIIPLISGMAGKKTYEALLLKLCDEDFFKT